MAGNIQIKRQAAAISSSALRSFKLSSSPSNSTQPAAAAAAIPPSLPPPPPPPSAISGSVADDLERLFIAVIRRHPILYCRTHPQSQPAAHPAAHAGAWRQVAAEMRLEVNSCKSLWSCIKQKYIKYRKRREATAAAVATTEQTKEWPLYEAMHEWLDANIQRRRSRLEMFKLMCNNQQQGGWQPTAADVSDSAGSALMVAADGDEANSVDSADWRELPDQPRSEDEDGLAEDAEAGAQLLVASSNAEKSSATPPAAPLKRTLSGGYAVSQPVAKMQRCMKIEIIQEPVAFVQSEATAEEEEEVEQAEAPAALQAPAPPPPPASVAALEVNRLQQTFGKCVEMLEQCVHRQRQPDADEVFGRLIASMVREIPAERRRAARVELLQLAGDVLAQFGG